MGKNFEYTTLAHRYTARFPVLTYIGTQTNFWIIANTLLVVIIHLHWRIIIRSYKIPVDVSFGSTLLIGVILGVLYGVMLGLVGYYLDRKFSRNQGLGKVIVFKTLTSLGVLILMLTLLRYVFFDPLFSLFKISAPALSEESWPLVFFLLWCLLFFYDATDKFHQSGKQEIWPGHPYPIATWPIP